MIYKFLMDHDIYAVVLPATMNVIELEEMLLRGGSDESLEFKIPRRREEPLADFMRVDNVQFAVREAAYDDLFGASPNLLITVHGVTPYGQYRIARPAIVVDCLDERKTKYRSIQGTKIRYPIVPVLVRQKLDDSWMFMVKGIKSSVFCSQSFKTMVEMKGLTGLIFEEVTLC